jgi:hypothetical protein
MQFLKLSRMERSDVLKSLQQMPERLRFAFASLRAEEAAQPGPGGAFAPVEQVWHLADLEREGFGERIDALLARDAPHLPDFDGTAIAAARNYRTRSLADGLNAFAQARRRNLLVLRTVEGEQWSRAGTQEGVGAVSLCDMPVLMFEHDAAHEAEIAAWRAHRSS